MLTKQFHKCGRLHFHTHTFVLHLVKKRKWKGIQFKSVRLRTGWGCWEGGLMGLFYVFMLIITILHIFRKIRNMVIQNKMRMPGEGDRIDLFHISNVLFKSIFNIIFRNSEWWLLRTRWGCCGRMDLFSSYPLRNLKWWLLRIRWGCFGRMDLFIFYLKCTPFVKTSYPLRNSEWWLLRTKWGCCGRMDLFIFYL